MWWSWGLTAASLLGLWAIGNKWRIGWIISLCSEGLWMSYGIITKQYGFILMAVVFAVMHVRNWIKWGKRSESPVQ